MSDTQKPNTKGRRTANSGKDPAQKSPKFAQKGKDFAGNKPWNKDKSGYGSPNRQSGWKKKPMDKPTVEDARRLAFNALSDVVRNQAYSGLALSKQLRASNLSPEDKRLVTNIFYTTLENLLRIDYVLGQFVKSPPEPVVEDILRIGAAQLLFMDKLPDHAVVDQAVKQVKLLSGPGLTGFANGTLRSLIRARDGQSIQMPDRALHPIRWLSIMHSVPEPLVKRLVDVYGVEVAQSMMAYKPDERTEVIRPNFMRMENTEFESYLDKRGWQWEPSVVPGCYRVKAAGDLPGDPDFRAGLFSIQGEASALAASSVSAKPGGYVLDACAAPGGKACYIAERMNGTGRVFAWDVHEHRVELIRAAKTRLGLDNLRPLKRDASVGDSDMNSTMDAVLIDAPCSGLGVMVNKPDIKYNIKDEDIHQLIALQAEILEACCAYVRPGGQLVYSTCTILPEENQLQVQKFLEKHPEFSLDTSTDWLSEALRQRGEDGMVQLQAHVDQMEGFFIARMVRSKENK